jgi:hypothetical protein
MAGEDGSLQFVAVLESGDLERKCALLLRSIREFGGPWSDAPCWFVQPRRGPLPVRRTRDVLFRMDARFVACDLNRDWTHYPIANKILAAAFVERLLPADETVLCFLDSDMICLGPPRDLLLDGRFDVGIRPVDRVGRAQRAGEPLDEYWKRVLEICGADPGDAWTVRTVVERVEILACFNAGLIASRCRAALFRHWAEALGRARRAGPFLGKQLRNLDQALLAGVVLRHVPRERVNLLGPSYNYPLHLQDELPAETAAASTEQIALAHYHGLFDDRACLATLPWAERHRHWLDPRLPIAPRWQRPFRRIRRHLAKSPELRARTPQAPER